MDLYSQCLLINLIACFHNKNEEDMSELTDMYITNYIFTYIIRYHSCCYCFFKISFLNQNKSNRLMFYILFIQLTKYHGYLNIISSSNRVFCFGTVIKQ